MTRLPTYFVSHGGGPWPWMAENRAMYAPLAESLRQISQEIGVRPKAVLSVSAHWEESSFTAMASAKPPMVYDYHGFPAHTYSVQYPAPGAPELAHQIDELLRRAGLPTAIDSTRGFDHGTFAPLAVMYPQANIPVLQLSLQCSLDPELHLAAGRALAPLREEGVLIVGSGQSFHNLRLLGPRGTGPSGLFDAWLHETLEQRPPVERSARLREWAGAPAARIAHPREEHLLPLMVVVGAAEQEAAQTQFHQSSLLGCAVSSFRFGALAEPTPPPSLNHRNESHHDH